MPPPRVRSRMLRWMAQQMQMPPACCCRLLALLMMPQRRRLQGMPLRTLQPPAQQPTAAHQSLQPCRRACKRTALRLHSLQVMSSVESVKSLVSFLSASKQYREADPGIYL